MAERLAREDSGLVPVLVTMRELTKGRTLDQLLAQHMSGEDSYHRASFRYLLREGKVALLFDGFELAQRTDYDRVVDHFNTLREAAGGSATVIVTSRHQYFATDRDVRTALGGQAQALPGSRIMRLLPLDAGQRRTLVVEDFDDEAAADHFLEPLGDVRDLLSLAENPRMLRWYRTGVLTEEKLTADGDQPMTAGRLYERLLTTWLTYEMDEQVDAQSPIDSLDPPAALLAGQQHGDRPGVNEPHRFGVEHRLQPRAAPPSTGVGSSWPSPSQNTSPAVNSAVTATPCWTLPAGELHDIADRHEIW